MTSAEKLRKVRDELARYEHPLFEFAARENGEQVELVIRLRNNFPGLHEYVYSIHARELEHPQFTWTFQRQLYDCLHYYVVEMFTRNPQKKE